MSDREKLEGAFRRGLGLPPDADVASLAYGKSDAWDSVAHMQLIAEIERTFDILLDTDDVIAMSSFTVACQLLGDHHGVRAEA